MYRTFEVYLRGSYESSQELKPKINTRYIYKQVQRDIIHLGNMNVYLDIPWMDGSKLKLMRIYLNISSSNMPGRYRWH